ncbi:MAG: ATP-binding protein [Candidatus Tantalella remota]|nr:ATP-binding protein [Candidatus Tantalella remota]
MRIRTKLTLSFLIMTFLILFVGYFSVKSGEIILQKNISQKSFMLSMVIMDKIDRDIFKGVEELQIFTNGTLVREGLEGANRKFSTIENKKAYIERQDRKWRSAKEGLVTPFMAERIDDPVSRNMRQKFIEFYQNKYGYKVFGEVFITNKYGVNVFETGKTTDYYQADEVWWKAAKKDALYVSEVRYDKSAQIYSIDVGIRIDDQNGDFIGVLKASLNIEGFINIIKEIEAGTADVFYLITRAGEIIYKTAEFEYLENVPGEMLVYLKEEDVFGEILSLETKLEGSSKDGEVYVHAYSTGYGDFKGLGWILVIEQATEVLFAPIMRLKNFMIIIALFTAILAVVIGFLVSRSISRPVTKLRDALIRFGKGDRKVSVDLNSKDEIGELAHSFLNMADDLKRTTVSIEVLEESKKRFEDIADSTGDWIWEVDTEGKCTYSSSGCVKLLGYSPEEVVGKVVYNFIHPENREEVRKNISQAFFHKEPFKKLEFRSITKSGEVVILEITGIPVLDREGDLLGYRGVNRDITERKKTEQSLLENVKLKTDFTSMVSHELRTPLTAIREGIGIVLDGSTGDVNEDQKDFLATAKRNVDRLVRLINDVLDFTKLEAGKMLLDLQEKDISKVLKEAAEVHAAIAKEKAIELKIEVAPDIPRVKIDPDRVIQVITNLINNAFKFTVKGSITLRADARDGKVFVCVEDTGSGIRQEDIPKLFEEFRQLEDKNKRKIGESGLGLAISRKIIMQHGGNIWVESEYGKGARFSFTLPIEREYRILVIDDDPEVRGLYRKILRKEGYTVIAASTGKEGIEKAQKEVPGLIILDMWLPDITGYEVIGRLRSEKDVSVIPILAVSGYPEELDDLERIKPWTESQAIPRLTKPFNNDVLLEMVGSLLK